MTGEEHPMADPTDRLDESAGAIPPEPVKKAAAKKAPATAAKKAPARKSAAKKAPAKAAEKAPEPTAPEPPVSAAPAPPTVEATAVLAAPTPREAAIPETPPPPSATRNSGVTRTPLMIGLAAVSLVAMLIRRLRRG
jgi:hypothetical protein